MEIMQIFVFYSRIAGSALHSLKKLTCLRLVTIMKISGRAFTSLLYSSPLMLSKDLLSL